MSVLFDAALWNVVAATALAGVVWAVARFVRAPAVTHVLWGVVLVKLVVPPILVLPILPAADLGTGLLPGAWLGALGVLWLGGAALLLGLAIHRTRRFARLAVQGRRGDPALLAGVAEQCGVLGLRRVPTVRVVEANIAPVVLARLSGPLLVLPAPLLETLDADGRRAIVAHELAHLRRGDHWLRWFETSIVGCFWWLPIAWWARRRMRQAEERACDEVVLRSYPALAHTYAETLLATVEFLEASPAGTAVRTAGMAHGMTLRRRFKAILKPGLRRRPAAWTPRLAVAMVAVLALSVAFAPADGTAPDVNAFDLIVVGEWTQTVYPTPSAGAQADAPKNQIVHIKIETESYPTK